MLYTFDLNLCRGCPPKKCTAPLRSEEKISRKVVELLRALGYDGVRI